MNILKKCNPRGLSIVIVVLLCNFLLFSTPVYARLLKSTGKVTMLRVHNVGTKYGPAKDQIDTEVVIKLSTSSGKAFGFKLRNDVNRFAHQGMLDLLRDAFNLNHNVTIVYNICSGNDVKPACKNGTIIRVWLTK